MIMTAHGHGTTVIASYTLIGIMVNLMVIMLKIAREYTQVAARGMIMTVMNRKLSSAEVSTGIHTRLIQWQQWRSHWGGKGGRVPPLTAKICQKSGKLGKEIRKNREERGKIGKKRQKSGSFFHFAPPPWQIKLATLLSGNFFLF